MRTWGVLATATADASDVARFRDLLEDHLDGVVEVPSGHRPTALNGSITLGELAAGLSAVPSDVERIVYLDTDALDGLGVEPVLQMLSWLDDDHAAVVRAVPVTDALKRVEGSIVVASVDRTGLYAPQPPHIVRRDVLAAALLADAGSDRDTVDLAALLVGAGHAVRVVYDGSPPVTLAARP